MYVFAMSYRTIASKMFQALLTMLTEHGCNCEYVPEVSEWYEAINGTTSMADRMRYAREHPFPNVDDPVSVQCLMCATLQEYQELVGDEAVMLERSHFLSNINRNSSMPEGLRAIFEEELGRFNMDELTSALMAGDATEEMITAVERAQERANEYLRQYDNGH